MLNDEKVVGKTTTSMLNEETGLYTCTTNEATSVTMTEFPTSTLNEGED